MENNNLSYKDLLIPILNILNFRSQNTEELILQLSKYLNISDDYLNKLTACGRQKKFNNQVVIARTFLRKNDLINISEKKILNITNKGKSYLKDCKLK